MPRRTVHHTPNSSFPIPHSQFLIKSRYSNQIRYLRPPPPAHLGRPPFKFAIGVGPASQGQTVRQLTFYEAHCTRLLLRFDARGQDGKAAVELKLRFSPAAVELNGTYIEGYSRLWWKLNARVRHRAFVRPGPVLPPLPPLPSVALAALKQAAQALGKAAGAVLGTAALVLTPANDANAPGYEAEKNFSQDHPTLPPDPDACRLAELERAREARALTPDEEAEYVALLAKVKGIRVRNLADLADANAAKLPLQGLDVPLRGFTYLHDFAYTKRPPADKAILRRKFESSGRKAFLKSLSDDPLKMDRLKKLGMSEENLERIRRGEVPLDYQVHHKLSLDDGGDNSISNLVLIRDDPYHRAITAFQNSSTRGLQPGATKLGGVYHQSQVKAARRQQVAT